MLNIEQIKKLKTEIEHVQSNKTEIEQFVFAALNQFTLKRASELTGLHISKLSRALSGNGLNDDDLFTAFIAITKKI